MEYSSWILSSICLLFSLNADGFPTEDNSYIERLTFGEIEDFVATQSAVYHMEADLFNPGNILYSDSSSLKTTNGNYTSTVVGHATSTGYNEGTGDSARFNHVLGFFQLNKTHVIVTDYNNHCLRLVHRESQQTSHFSGLCGSGGYANGAATKARFFHPDTILLDKTNNNSLIISQSGGYNNVLKAVDIETGSVTTAVSSGLSQPRGMAWDPEEDTLYVTNTHYIAAVNWTSKQTVRLAGSTSSGNRLGDFKQALLYYPAKLHYLKEKTYILIDTTNRELKLIDIKSQTIGTVCVTEYCKLDQNYAMTLVNDSLYIAVSSQIQKLMGQDCVAVENIYLHPEETTVTTIIDSHGTRGKFPAGEYQFYLEEGECSSYKLKVNKTSIVRRLALKAEYSVECSKLMLGNAFGRGLLELSLKHQMTHYNHICSADCRMSTSLKPSYACLSNVLRVVWPTDTVYTMGVKEVPPGLLSKLKARLQDLETGVAELTILNEQTQFILPSVSNGLRVQATLNSTCVEYGKQYQPSTDECQ